MVHGVQGLAKVNHKASNIKSYVEACVQCRE